VSASIVRHASAPPGTAARFSFSNATAGIVEDLAIAGAELEDPGEHRLKDIARPQRLFQLNVERRTSRRLHGVHSRRIADARSGYFGSTAFRCSLLCRSAEPWQILVSHATEALLEEEAADVGLRDLGERTLNAFEEPAHVFELL
jgi:class 3 adenylate cyclase